MLHYDSAHWITICNFREYKVSLSRIVLMMNNYLFFTNANYQLLIYRYIHDYVIYYTISLYEVLCHDRTWFTMF